MQLTADSLAALLHTLQQVIAHLPSAVSVCEAPSGVIRLYNRRAVELWGREPSLADTHERFGGSFRLWRADGRLLAPADTPMAETLRDGALRNEEVVIERPDGTRVSVRVNIAPLRDPHGQMIGVINVFQDTERQQTAEAAARLAAIVASATDAIVSKTLEGIVTSWNGAAEKMFGYSEAEMVGQPIMTIIPAERQGEEDEILRRLKRGETIAHFETERITRDGRRIPISLTISPIIGPDGRVIGASKIARDITERKRAEAAVRRSEREREELLGRERRARAQAEAANQAKDEFLAMLAHELRNPLSVIANAVAVIDRSVNVHPEPRRAGVVIRRQTEHLARLLDDLLDVARITSGRIELDYERLDLRSAVEQAVDAQRFHTGGKRQHVSLSLPEQDVTIIADSVRLQQVIGNLLNNASKYTPAGGSITVMVDVAGDEAFLRVRDNGTGIAPDKLDSIFELFVQANPTLARTEGGLGIGLTLVKRIVELHGGGVRAHSEGVDRGAEFVVRLPLAAPDQGPASSWSAPASVPARRILIVEDNDDGREMLATMLRLGGHEVLEAATGQQALTIAAGSSPDAVLVDIGLPDVSGYDLGRELRHKLGRQARIVALTGYGQPHDRARSEAAGFDAHLVKPVNPSKLAATLRDA